MFQTAFRIGIRAPARRPASYTFPGPIRKTGFWRATAAAMLLLAVFASSHGQAHAQGSRIESFFDDAGRFLERQGRAIERELNQMSAPAPATRPATGRPPLPLRNPRREAPLAVDAPAPAESAEAKQPPPLQRPEPAPEKPEAPEQAAQPEQPQGEDRTPDDPLPEKTLAFSGPGDPDETKIPPPERNPKRDGEKKDAEKPEPPPHPGQMASEEWSREEIEGARDACAKTVSGAVISHEPSESLREGICGAPAPIRLSAVNADPRIEIHPAGTVTCAMAAGLARWMTETVQPAAREHLGEDIVSVRNVASYSCRNRYNAPGKRISEHALANALDIASFETASGKTVTLLEHWDAKQGGDGDAAAAQARHSAGETAADAARMPAGASAKASPASAKRALVRADDAARASPPAPDRKPDSIPVLEPAPESRFLRAAFDGACKIFGTTLGPESNAAHRDHFHFDMKERSYGGYCE